MNPGLPASKPARRTRLATCLGAVARSAEARIAPPLAMVPPPPAMPQLRTGTDNLPILTDPRRHRHEHAERPDT